MKKILQTRPLDTDFGILLLRMLVGGLFIYYGYFKLQGVDSFLPMFPDLIGIGSRLSYFLVIFAELVCGFFVLIGLATRFTVIPITITMFVAYFLAHKNDPFDAKQIVLVYLVLTVVLFILGSGKYSVDRLIIKNK